MTLHRASLRRATLRSPTRRDATLRDATLHFVLPNDIDDPARPSGGNAYDRRLIDGLTAKGVAVRAHPVVGSWPQPTAASVGLLAALLDHLPAGAVVVVDGLIASAVPSVLSARGDRLRLVVLLHMPLGDAGEGRALAAGSAVVTTSRWSRSRVLDLYDLAPERVHVATPGVDPAPLAPGTPSGTRLLCVAAVTHHKGHDVLVSALHAVGDLPWECACVGSLDVAPDLVGALRRAPVADRLHLTGPLRGADLGSRYAGADLLVLASRAESYGMVVTEALARGLPVVASDAQGLPEALGVAPDGSRPGILVPPGDPSALADALRGWLTSPSLRRGLRDSARARRATLAPWTATVDAFLAALPAKLRVHSGR